MPSAKKKKILWVAIIFSLIGGFLFWREDTFVEIPYFLLGEYERPEYDLNRLKIEHNRLTFYDPRIGSQSCSFDRVSMTKDLFGPGYALHVTCRPPHGRRDLPLMREKCWNETHPLRPTLHVSVEDFAFSQTLDTESFDFFDCTNPPVEQMWDKKGYNDHMDKRIREAIDGRK